ncbi:MAG: exo-alpha-sialidase [Anaerolineae bacterium]|nr:exo-alpha-sialidase [Anaerolineae bacterium]
MSKVAVNHQTQSIHAEHGVVCTLPGEFFGYFGWPSVARLTTAVDTTAAADIAAGDLVVVASGFRHTHVDPFGRTVLLRSRDEGATWTAPQVINDLPIDDRDAGIVDMGGGNLLVSWFSSDTRRYDVAQTYAESDDPQCVQRYADAFRRMTDATVRRWLGSWVRLSDDGGDTWGLPLHVPVTAPHGPIWLPEKQALLYLGKVFDRHSEQRIQAWRSEDRGHTWHLLGTVPLAPKTVAAHYHEPHVVALPSGRLLGLIRIQDRGAAPWLFEANLPDFSMVQTTSDDGGRTWTTPQPLGFHGSPPHLLRHSTGALVAVYGYRLAAYGERAMISYDNGASWKAGYVLRDDGPDGDLGYPASVELSDGSLFTVYYQKRAGSEPCSLLWSRWRLP